MSDHLTPHRIVARMNRLGVKFYQFRFGSDVPKRGPTVEDQIILQLMRGPALATDLPCLKSGIYAHITDINKRVLSRVGRKIVGKRLEVVSKRGLKTVVRQYEMVRV